MKKIVMVLALAVAASTNIMAQNTVVSTQNTIPALNVKDMGNLHFKLAFENPLKQRVQIYLVDKNNEIYFNEYTNGSAKYVKSFDLANLSDGKYTFVVDSGKEKVTKNFVISTKTLRGISLASNK